MTGGSVCTSCGVAMITGQTLSVGTTVVPGSARVNGRPMLWLQDPSGAIVASNQAYQGTYSAYFDYTARSSGNYFILEGFATWSSSSPTTVGYGSASATAAWTLSASPSYAVVTSPPPSGAGCVRTRAAAALRRVPATHHATTARAGIRAYTRANTYRVRGSARVYCHRHAARARRSPPRTR